MAKGLQLFVFFMPSDLISSFFWLSIFRFFLGPAASKLAAAMLRGSLFARPFRLHFVSPSVWPSATPPQRWAAHPEFLLLGCFLRRLGLAPRNGRRPFGLGA
ncbi:hypothetical protein SGRA_3421 [Saprospira grandis str. Lewin]|uniref:Uncharacterized protein n=1 Tax=Saprospira grandis (strain Lewin) TaxID=984262 RepID=H6L1R8_SAPGL|nr:hypothetical protein SGRA_3421 [Saprospira grandis str. Lewin]